MEQNTLDHFEGKTDQEIEEMKQRTVRHLRSLSDQSMRIPIPAQKDLTVTELISEVESLSPAGKQFINAWMDTLKQVERLRKSKVRVYRNAIHRFLVQLLCSHKWELVDKEEIFPDAPDGGAIAFVRPHICSKCDKTTTLGSGWIL